MVALSQVSWKVISGCLSSRATWGNVGGGLPPPLRHHHLLLSGEKMEKQNFPRIPESDIAEEQVDTEGTGGRS